MRHTMCSAGEGLGPLAHCQCCRLPGLLPMWQGSVCLPFSRDARVESCFGYVSPPVPLLQRHNSLPHTSQTSANIQSYERIFAANGPPPPPKEDAAAAGKQAGAKSARERSKAKGPSHSHYLQSKVYRALERIKAERAGEEPVDAAAVEGEAAAAVAEAAEAVAKQQEAAEAKEGEKKQ